MKYRAIASVLVVCVILSVALGACSKATPTAAPAAQPTAVQPTAAPASATPLKVALLTFGTVADGGWNATAYDGLKALATKYGVKMALSDDVKIPDMEAAIRDYCSQGYDLVIAHSTPFGDPALKVAKDFPNCKITVTSNAVSAENVASYYPKEVENHFLAGAFMALMSKTGKIGLIGGVELSNTIAKFNALEDGARLVNPNIQVFKSWVGSWDDPAKGKELALAQIAQGADVIDHTAATSGLGVIEAAAQNNAWVISDVVLNQDLAPKNMLAAHTQNYPGMVEYFYKQVADGAFKGEAFRPGLASGLEDLVLSDNVPPDVAAKIKDIKQQIIDGKIKVEEKFEPNPAQPAAAQSAANMKIAFLTFGPSTDSGWSSTAYEGFQRNAQKYGFKPAMTDGINIPDMEAVLRDYCSQGYDLVIGHSSPFGPPALKVAPDFPKCKMVIDTGTVKADNVASYLPLEAESHFLSGVLMALMSKGGKVGIIAGVDMPNVRAKVNAIQAGAKYVNPNIQIRSAYVGSWADPAKGKELALAQISDGVDVLDQLASTSGLGVVEAAVDKNIPVVNDVWLNTALAPKVMIGSHTQEFEKEQQYWIEQVINGTFKGEVYRPGLASGFEDFVMSDLVPADIQAKVNAVKQDIIDGKLKVEEKFD